MRSWVYPSNIETKTNNNKTNKPTKSQVCLTLSNFIYVGFRFQLMCSNRNVQAYTYIHGGPFYLLSGSCYKGKESFWLLFLKSHIEKSSTKCFLLLCDMSVICFYRLFITPSMSDCYCFLLLTCSYKTKIPSISSFWFSRTQPMCCYMRITTSNDDK